jgi:protein-disulfide isomerase
MRWWGTLAVIVGTLVASTGCTSTVGGVAVAPQGAAAASEVALTADGFGIQLGKPWAPAQIDIYAEPQCPHCAAFERHYADDIARAVTSGQLVVTYRLLTFLDSAGDDYSARVSNAIYLAAEPKGGASAAAILNFIKGLYRQMTPFATSTDAAAIAKIARDNGIPSQVADRIAAGDNAVDAEAMNNANQASLEAISPDSPGTPTVYDTVAKQVVDVTDPGWIHNLVKSA